ncbi:origin recognition complex subunit 2 isoform X2 [Orussus abietinus]|uniref:origin recognition complex subunit 2 isoform X2 n=1 Tax=Orussus abietinus TaxID=222816 RepID=UPI000625295F|nr:origin recognition complex subunit 2 isoform X2 [Orussus abietinus]
MAEGGEKLRRSTRIKTVVKPETSDDFTEKTNVKRRLPKQSRNDSSSDTEFVTDPLTQELQKELEDIDEDVQKPKELFTDNDISGQQLYGFQTPSKKGAMVQKANLCRTPTTPQVITQFAKLRVIVERATVPNIKFVNKATRSHNRSFKERMSSESESVSEGSEFVPSDSHDEESEEADTSINQTIDSLLGSNSDEDKVKSTRKQIIPSKESKLPSDNRNEESEEDETSLNESTDSSLGRNSKEDNIKTIRKQRGPSVSKAQIPSTPSVSQRRIRTTYKDYHLKTDDYFASQSEKTITSDRTLGRLVNPRLDEQKLQELLSSQNHITAQHKRSICSLSESYRALFSMWSFIMEEGYSLLLYGLGSKRNLINDFHTEVVSEFPTLIVNGFFPGLSIKDILDGIIVDLLDKDSPTNPNDGFDLIEKMLQENPMDRLYLLIHNIDGFILRANKIQDVLSRLASIPNLHLMASIDHINAPLIWDNVKRSRYNFYWWDVTTFLPYEAETSYEGSLLVQQNEVLALSSLRNVFLSLTSNARAIYIILVKYQLENGYNSNYPGMAFKHLYQGAREAFLVSSDMALKAQLTEFLDHKLVRNKRNMDGTEYLIIPLDKAVLKQFLEQHDES